MGDLKEIKQWRKKASPHFFALEPRMLFDGVSVIENPKSDSQTQDSIIQNSSNDINHDLLQAVSSETNKTLDNNVETTNVKADSSSITKVLQNIDLKTGGMIREVNNPKEILFIDSAVRDFSSLISDTRDDVEIILLGSEQNPWAQMTEVLRCYEDIKAIHIVSHGSEGDLILSGQNFTNENINQESIYLSDWKNHLNQSADILVYGCDIASGIDGNLFISNLAKLTMRDVAGSTNITGASSLGGDWILENTTGQIEVNYFYKNKELINNYQDTLAALAAPSGVTWFNVFKSTNYDPNDDQQANAGQDIVGNASNAMLQASNTGTGADLTYYFRVRYGESSINGTSFYLAIDFKGPSASSSASDGIADFFIEAQVASNGSTALVLHQRDTSKTGTGPSNTQWLNSNSNTSIELALSTTDSYVGTTPVTTDANATVTDLDGGTSGNDTWLVFGFKLSAIQTFTTTSGSYTSSAITSSSPLVFYAFTSTSQTANGDIAGINDKTANLNDTWQNLLGTTIATSLTTLTSITSNDAPVLDNTKTPVLGNLTEDASTPSGVVGTLISSLVDIGGSLSNVSDIDPGAFTGIALTSVDSTNGTWYYTTDAGVTWTTVGVITGSSALLLKADSNSRLYFKPNANWNGTVSNAITFRAWDQTSGTAGTKVDTTINGGITPYSLATDTANITITAVNDAPVASGSATLVAVNEDTASPSGATVSSLFSGNFSDSTDTVSDGSSANTLAGIAITGYTADTNKGNWQYTTNGSTWTTIGTVSDSSALTLGVGSNDKLRFLPTANWNGTAPSLTVRLIDSSTTVTSGATGVNVSSNGGTTAISAATVSLGTSITAVNDAPVVTAGGTLSYTENATATAVDTSITVTDVDSTNLTGATVTISSGLTTGDVLACATQNGILGSYNSGTGVLTLTGSATVANYQAALRSITYASTSDNPTATSTSRTITWQVNDGSASNNLSTGVTSIINIIAVNDAAVISGTSTGSITETNVAQTITGTLTSTDVDGTDNLFTALSSTAGSNGYGHFSMTTGGVWTYIMDSAHNEFVAGQTYTDSVTVTTADSTSQVITVTITGTNDAAVISGTSTGSITETNVAQTITGTLTSTDVDGTDNLFTALSSTAGSNGYGHFSMTTGGVWTYIMDSAHNEFVAGQTYTDSVTVTTADSTSQVITVTITGTNDAAVISGTSTGSITETNVAQTITGTLTSTDVDGTDNLFTALSSTAGSNGYGHFSMTTGGVWTYIMDSAHNEFVAGQTYTDSVTVTTADSTSQVITVTITGTNDAAVISGTSTGSITETNVAQTITGTLTSTDVDGTDNLFTALSSTAGSNGYGHFSMTTGGVWTYIMDSAHNEFVAGQTYTDSVTVTTADSTSQVITVTITGTNDAAVISGTSTGSITETNVAQTITGTLTSTDVDGTDNLFTALSSTAGSNGYGHFSMTTGGVWTYIMDSAHNEFVAGQTYTDSVTVTTADSTSQVITVTITGTNDAAVISGTSTGSITETNVAQTITGTLTSTDVDGTDNLFTALSSTAGSNGYGHFSMTTGGVWTYIMDSAHNEFVAGQTYTDSVTVTTADSTSQVITVTITGTNDAAVISGTSTGSITETNVAQTITGTLTSTDVDGTDNLFTALSSTAGSNGYGHFSMTTGGVWTYIMDSAHNEFVAGQTYTDSVTVTTADSTSQVITVTITGTNDAAVISGTSTGSITETNVAQTITGTLTSTDVDGTDNLFTALSSTAGSNGYGHFSMTTGGVWTYIMDSAHNEFVAGQTYTDSVTVTTADSTSQVITVTITGTNDAAVISGTSTGSITETNVAQTITGTLTSTDVDGTDNLFTALSSTAGSNGYGHFSMTTGGVWTYIMDSAHNEFVAGQTYTDSVTVTTADSTSQVITVTITGTNDAPIINDATINLDEKSANAFEVYDVNTIGGVTNDTDADGQSVMYSIQSGNDLGIFAIDASTGKISVNDATKLDSKTTPIFNLVILASDNSIGTPLTDTATITINVSSMNNNLTFLTRNMPPPGMGPKREVATAEGNETEIETNKLTEDLDEVSIAIKPNFVKPTLVNTQLKNSVKPLKIASPEMPVKDSVKSDNNNAQQQNALNQKNETGLRNTLTPPDAMTDHKGHVTYKLPEGTFSNGHGAVSMIAVQKDGSPLPSWIKFDGVTGKISADVPKGVSAPLEIKIQATDSKGDKAETVFKIQPRVDKVSFVGKKSLSEQFKNAFDLVA